MTNRNPWDKFETALLIDTFWLIEHNPQKKQEYISILSEKLRKKAINAGLEIDDKYRNINGIGMQLTSIAHAFYPERPSLTSNKIFNDIVNLYKTDMPAFNAILHKAEKMVVENTIQAIPKGLSFKDWFAIAGKNSGYSYDLLIETLNDANLYLAKKTNTNISIFDINNPAQFSATLKSISSSKDYNRENPGALICLTTVTDYYKKYLFYRNDGNSINITSRSNNEKQLSEKNNIDIKNILQDKFKFGFKPGSYIDLLRFRKFAEEKQIIIPEKDADLINAINSAGETVGDKVFPINNNLQHELGDVINAITQAGVNVIYYDVLFEEKRIWMENHFIVSADYLKELSKKFFTDYSFSKEFMSTGFSKRTEKEAVTDEIKRVWGEDQTCSLDELRERLPYIPYENLCRVISGNINFSWVSEGIYFLVDKFIISPEEKNAILHYVELSCNTKGFASLSDVPLGDIVEQNYELPLSTIFSAIYNKVLFGKYFIKGKILTKDNSDLDAVTLLKNSIADVDVCSFDEMEEKVINLIGNTNRQIAFQVLYDCMIRVDNNNFVANKFVSFDVNEIDKVLSKIIKAHFCAIKDITSFALFPVCGYQWNTFILESYCYRFSKKYCLHIHNFNSKNAGIIAEKAFNKDYNEMLAIFLAGEKIELLPEIIGPYLFQTGYMAKRKYGKLDEIAERARTLRRIM